MNANIKKIVMWALTLLLMSSCAQNQPLAKKNQELKTKKFLPLVKRYPNRKDVAYSKSNIQISTLERDANVKRNKTVTRSSSLVAQYDYKCISKLQCVSLIRDKIIELWKFPKSYPKYKTVLVLELSTSGHISTIRLKHSSGRRGYDDAVINAVRRAAPFREITFLPMIDVQEFSSLELVFKR